MTPARLVAACLLLAPLAPLPAQVTYDPESVEVLQLKRLYLRAGEAFPAAGFPLSEHTLAAHARRLAVLAEDPAVREEAEAYLESLAYVAGATELALINRVSLEGYVRAGESAASDWVHEFLDREPLWELRMSWARLDKAGFFIEPILHREYFGDLPFWNLPASREGNPVALENDQLAKGFLWFNLDPLQIELGRDQVHFGPLRSALLPSSRLPFLDLLRLTLPVGRLTMDLMISSLQNRNALEDLALPSDEPIPPSGAADIHFNTNIIFANLHRFEYDFGRVRAAVSGLGIFVRENNAFALADFFPVSSWHATQYRPFNLSLVFDLEAALFPGFRLMTQFGFDDVNANFFGTSDAPIPTIPAVIAGFEYQRQLRWAALELDLYGEAGYTHYLWGNFDDENHAVLARAIYRLFLDHGTRTMPLTSPYGPGAVWLFLEGALRGSRGLYSGLSAELVFRNPEVDLIHTVYETDAAAGALANKTGTLKLGIQARYRPWKWLELYTRPVLSIESGAAALEVVLGGTAVSDRRRFIRGGQAR
jgi:hypothetical protein